MSDDDKLTVRVINWNLDDWNDTIVLRGVIDVDSLQNLRVDVYQREFLPSKSRSRIIQGIKEGVRLPDMELGMRGQHFRTNRDQTAITLTDPVFIIDGRQRRDTVMDMISSYPNVHLGALIHFGTNEPWERRRFQTLNADRAKVSPSIILRNLRNEVPAIGMLYGLCMADKNFPLHNKVTWSQQGHRGELIKCMIVANAALRLHTHLIAQHFGTAEEIAKRLDRLGDSIGLAVLRDNIKSFWQLIDECWGINQIHYRANATYIRGAFLNQLAKMLSDHKVFWRQPTDKRLEVPRILRLKLAKFPVSDPTVANLAGSGGSGKAAEMLGMMMIEHMNSGKRSGRLVTRRILPPVIEMEEAEAAYEKEAELVE